MNIRSFAIAVLLLVGMAGQVFAASSPIGAPPQSVLGLGPNVLLFGATGNGSTDDSAAMTLACGAAFASGNRYVSVPTGTYNAATLQSLGAAFTGSSTGTTLDVTAVSSGSLAVGQIVNIGISTPAVIVQQLATAGGDVSTWKMSAANTLGSTPLTSSSSCYDEILVGQGSLINEATGRKFVFDPTLAQAPEPVLSWNGTTQFARLASAKSPVIDIIGDSTCGNLAPNGSAQTEYLYEVLVKKIQADFGGNVTINNRCWAGQTWGSFASTGVQPVTNVPPWATNSSASWQSYVFADAPDAIVTDFGMNDGATANPSAAYVNMQTALAQLASQPKPPDIGIITNYVPSLVYNSTGTLATEEGREAISGWQRTYAQKRGLAYIDLGRQFDIARDGFDPVDQPLVTVTNTVTLASTATYTYPQTRDFSGTFTSTNLTNFWSGGTATITLTTSNDPGSSVVVSDSGGFIAVTVTPATGISAYPTVVSAIPVSQTVSGSNFFVNYSLKGGHLVILYQNLTVYDGLIDRPGSLFTPTVTCANPGDAVSRFIQGPAISSPRLYLPILTDYETFGNNSGTLWGGGGFNHAASRAVAEVAAKQVGAQQFNPKSSTEVAMSNLIINGEMQINQQKEVTGSGGNTLNTAATGLFFDRWRWRENNLVNRTFVNQSTAAPSGHSRSLFIGQNVNTNAPGSADFTVLFQLVEGPNIADLGWGAAGALPITLGFCAEANNAGTYPVDLANQAQNRSYVSSFTLAAANAWQCFSVVVPGDTGGTWVTTPGNTGLLVQFPQGFGSTYQTATKNAWQTLQFYGTASMTQLVTLSGGTMNITGVTLIKSGFAGAVIQRSYSDELNLARRFFSKTFPAGTAPAQNAGLAGSYCVKNPIALGDPAGFLTFPAIMAATPTVTTYNPSAANANWRDVTASADATVSVDPATALGPSGVTLATSGTVATLGDVLCIHAVADVGF